MNGSSPSSPPVAIVLGGDVNGLGVARSLGAAGVSLVLVDTDLSRPTMRTRHGHKRQAPALSGETFLDFLFALGRELGGRPVLFPTQEATVGTLSAAYKRIREAFALTLPDDALVRTLLDKTGFQDCAEKLGFAVPKSRFLRRDGSESVMDPLRFPCILKPTTKDETYAKSFAKAYRVESRDEAAALWRRMQAVIDSAIIQEWIGGGDSDVYFCLQYRPGDGGAVTSFCGRKTLQWPPLVGGTATCIPAPAAAAQLTAETSAFFEKTGFVGLCSMEYKRDPASGTFYMIEPTVGRTDYQEEIATLNGVNIPLMAYRHLSGASLAPPSPSAEPRGWRDPFGCYKARAAGASDPAAELMPGLAIADAYFRFNDPMPYLDTKLTALKKRLGLHKNGPTA